MISKSTQLISQHTAHRVRLQRRHPAVPATMVLAENSSDKSTNHKRSIASQLRVGVVCIQQNFTHWLQFLCTTPFSLMNWLHR